MSACCIAAAGSLDVVKITSYISAQSCVAACIRVLPCTASKDMLTKLVYNEGTERFVYASARKAVPC
jgi:hypothetical protein